jgi:hypothetical protein
LAKDDGQDWRPKNKIFTTVSPPGAKLDGMKKQTPEQRRAKARLRAESYRRRKGINPRKPAERPWLVLGISRSTCYRRRKQARKRAALASAQAAREALLDRLEWQLAELRAHLDRCARAQAGLSDGGDERLARGSCRRLIMFEV